MKENEPVYQGPITKDAQELITKIEDFLLDKYKANLTERIDFIQTSIDNWRSFAVENPGTAAECLNVLLNPNIENHDRLETNADDPEQPINKALEAKNKRAEENRKAAPESVIRQYTNRKRKSDQRDANNKSSSRIFVDS